MKVRMFDPAWQMQQVQPQMRTGLEEFFTGGQYVLGPQVSAFEAELARVQGQRFVVGVNSGSDALYLALVALGIRPGDEVITTSFTFFATVEAILRVRAIPVFADIDPATLLLDPVALAAAVTARTKAVLVVHLFGLPADMTAINQVAKQASLHVVEDCAQAFGATWRGQPVGSWGQIAAFSFFPTKPLGAVGDAGAVTTDDPEVADRVRRLRVHGSNGRDRFAELGCNSRLDALQAVVLRAKLPHQESWARMRREIAIQYREALPGRRFVFAEESAEAASAHALCTIRIPAEQRAGLQGHLAEREIESAVYYSVPTHLQPAVRAGSYRISGSLPETERTAGEVLSIPCYPGLPRSSVDRVIEALLSFRS